jgi:Ras-related protein Rab-1A
MYLTAISFHFLGAQGIIIVYDVTDRETFDNVRTWITEIEKYSQAGVCKILVGNKCDMEDKRQVSEDEGREFAAQFGMPFLETSAKATLQVDAAFETMTREIKDKIKSKPGAAGKGSSTPGGPVFG